MTLGQGHYTPLGWGQQSCEIFIKIQLRSKKWLRQGFKPCVHCDLDLAFESRSVKCEGGSALPHKFYKPTWGPKYVSNRPYNE